MSSAVLVVGGSAAGLQAARDLAAAGQNVHLVVSTPFLSPPHDSALPAHFDKLALLEVSKHPQISIWMNTSVEKFAAKGEQYRIRLRQKPRYVDLDKCTACGDCLAVCPVSVPATTHQAIFMPEGSQPQCAAIEKQGKAPCTNACPGGIPVQGYIALAARARFQEAIDLIRAAIPFPGICGRICTHPCEVNCRRAEIDAPVSIRLLKRFVSDWEVQNGPQTEALGMAQPQTGIERKRVAIVGAGPGGMTAAGQLTRSGHRVTVFDKLPVIGGMMGVGIPAYRLPREIITREYQHLQDLGVEIRLNTAIGPNGVYTLEDLLRKGYESICLAIGAHQSMPLGIAGEDLPGVVQGIDVLRKISLSQQLDESQYKIDLQQILRHGTKTRIAILGGGNTAIDVARSLRRLGIAKVQIVYRRTRAEMPALAEEIEYALEENIPITFLAAPIRVQGNSQTGVTGMTCIRMQLAEPDAGGRRRPVPIEQSEFQLDLDVIVVAIGQRPDLAIVSQDRQIQSASDQCIVVNDNNLMTGRPGVFAVGDAVTRDRRAVIEAIAMGKRVAVQIDAYLKGTRLPEGSAKDEQQPIVLKDLTAEDRICKPRTPVPVAALDKRINDFAEVEQGYTQLQATTEAGRCLQCGPCSECGACGLACRPQAIQLNESERHTELTVAAVIFADAPAQTDRPLFAKDQMIYRVLPESVLMGAAAAAKVLQHREFKAPDIARRPLQEAVAGPLRIGVFICECGDRIARTIDTQGLSAQIGTLPDVAHVSRIAFACQSEGMEIIFAARQKHELNRTVLAACACCAIDQVCFSCSYQRIRSKNKLGLFAQSTPAETELVNIREQCAWVHAHHPAAATLKSMALIAAAVSKLRQATPRSVQMISTKRSAFILGRSTAARYCQSVLTNQGILSHHFEERPHDLRFADSYYRVHRNGRKYEAQTIIVAPKDDKEARSLRKAMAGLREGSTKKDAATGFEFNRTGIFYSDPGADPEIAGMALGAQVVAWWGQRLNWVPTLSATVDSARCRACQTCVAYCPYGAPRIEGEIYARTAQIDVTRCVGCGICAAHCPSDAIVAGYTSDIQLDVMLDAMLE